MNELLKVPEGRRRVSTPKLSLLMGLAALVLIFAA